MKISGPPDLRDHWRIPVLHPIGEPHPYQVSEAGSLSCGHLASMIRR
jgi:hypothetical protein